MLCYKGAQHYHHVISIFLQKTGAVTILKRKTDLCLKYVLVFAAVKKNLKSEAKLIDLQCTVITIMWALICSIKMVQALSSKISV